MAGGCGRGRESERTQGGSWRELSLVQVFDFQLVSEGLWMGKEEWK